MTPEPLAWLDRLLFTSDDRATMIGQAIGSIFAVAVYVMVASLIVWQFFH